jgi:hypothetical protein
MAEAHVISTFSRIREEFSWSEIQAGLLAPGSPGSRAFPVLTSGIAARNIPSYSGGTATDFNRFPYFVT